MCFWPLSQLWEEISTTDYILTWDTWIMPVRKRKENSLSLARLLSNIGSLRWRPRLFADGVVHSILLSVDNLISEARYPYKKRRMNLDEKDPECWKSANNGGMIRRGVAESALWFPVLRCGLGDDETNWELQEEMLFRFRLNDSPFCLEYGYTIGDTEHVMF